MAHRRLNRPETGVCRESPAWLEGCSSVLGLWFKKLGEEKKRRANEDQLIAAGFISPRESAALPLSPLERKPFADWEKQRQL